MKQAIVLLVLGCAACGCASKTLVSYYTTVQIEPADKPGQYRILGRFVIETAKQRASLFGSGRSRRTTVLTTPKLICQAGQRASCTVGTEDESNNVLVEAYIARKGDPKPTTCFITVKEHGRSTGGS